MNQRTSPKSVLVKLERGYFGKFYYLLIGLVIVEVLWRYTQNEPIKYLYIFLVQFSMIAVPLGLILYLNKNKNVSLLYRAGNVFFTSCVLLFGIILMFSATIQWIGGSSYIPGLYLAGVLITINNLVFIISGILFSAYFFQFLIYRKKYKSKTIGLG